MRSSVSRAAFYVNGSQGLLFLKLVWNTADCRFIPIRVSPSMTQMQYNRSRRLLPR
jgi:hypothetical protein